MLDSIHGFCFNSFKIYFAERNPDSLALENSFDAAWLAGSEYSGIVHPAKQNEWLNARFLLKHACQIDQLPFYGLKKDALGKPFLEHTGVHISISHTAKYVACMIHQNAACGIDCERITDRMLKISPRVFSSNELNQLASLDHHTVYWSAKEAMFKLYGIKQVDFKEHLSVLPFDLSPIGSKFYGSVAKETLIDVAMIAFKISQDTWCVAAHAL